MTTKVSCDYCGNDLTETNCTDYRIRVAVEIIPFAGGTHYDVLIHPPLPKQEYHFCTKKCMQSALFPEARP